MRTKFVRLMLVSVIVLAQVSMTQAQDGKMSYPKMAPLNQYLMADRSAEIALARSAAPKSISEHAEILVMGAHGYVTAVKGTNGFVCLVERGWTAGVDDRDFWNPKARSPFCLNGPAAETYLPITIMKTRLILAGKSKAQMAAAITAALDEKKLPPIARGAMCYMMSKQGYLNNADGPWHPHLMFFAPLTRHDGWGANLPGSPLLADDNALERITIFMVPVSRWSDGTPDAKMEH